MGTEPQEEREEEMQEQEDAQRGNDKHSPPSAARHIGEQEWEPNDWRWHPTDLVATRVGASDDPSGSAPSEGDNGPLTCKADNCGAHAYGRTASRRRTALCRCALFSPPLCPDVQPRLCLFS